MMLSPCRRIFLVKQHCCKNQSMALRRFSVASIGQFGSLNSPHSLSATRHLTSFSFISSKCYICQYHSSQFNNIIKRNVQTTAVCNPIGLNWNPKKSQLRFHHKIVSQPSEIQKKNDSVQNIDKCDESVGNSTGMTDDGPSLKYFLKEKNEIFPTLKPDMPPYIKKYDNVGNNRKVYFETYGCQMNVNDTEIAWSILQENGFRKTSNMKDSDVILLMTCSIREGAEHKIWKRLEYLKYLKEQRKHSSLQIGVLGCMAERLKTKLVEKDKTVDIVCGPDAYRDLPHMLAETEPGQTAVNVLLSFDETYADVTPVRINSNAKSAFVSIMRGCDNMCTYCIVPFTRGRERSRPIASIIDEVKKLSDQGIKEVTLLGQNVNSYRDMSELHSSEHIDVKATQMSDGFKTVYKSKVGGRRFADLLERVSEVNSDMRIRFTSPHPKDFPDEVLYLIKDRPNICNHIHLPAQSGSSEVLKAMRRGYTAEAYISLVWHIKNILPDVRLSSDFIAGFCGETEDDHRMTIELMEEVKYHFAYCFPYSMRQKTHAHHRLDDDVPADIKMRRHTELCKVFRREAHMLNQAQIGEEQLILIEGESKRSQEDLAGRNEGNTKVIIPKHSIPVQDGQTTTKYMHPGDYVLVKIHGCSSQVLHGKALYHSRISDYSQRLEMSK